VIQFNAFAEHYPRREGFNWPKFVTVAEEEELPATTLANQTVTQEGPGGSIFIPSRSILAVKNQKRCRSVHVVYVQER